MSELPETTPELPQTLSKEVQLHPLSSSAAISFVQTESIVGSLRIPLTAYMVEHTNHISISPYIHHMTGTGEEIIYATTISASPLSVVVPAREFPRRESSLSTLPGVIWGYGPDGNLKHIRELINLPTTADLPMQQCIGVIQGDRMIFSADAKTHNQLVDLLATPHDAIKTFTLDFCEGTPKFVMDVTDVNDPVSPLVFLSSIFQLDPYAVKIGVYHRSYPAIGVLQFNTLDDYFAQCAKGLVRQAFPQVGYNPSHRALVAWRNSTSGEIALITGSTHFTAAALLGFESAEGTSNIDLIRHKDRPSLPDRLEVISATKTTDFKFILEMLHSIVAMGEPSSTLFSIRFDSTLGRRTIQEVLDASFSPQEIEEINRTLTSTKWDNL